jgi:hypothetical protein
MGITKESLRGLVVDIEAALKCVGEKHNLSIVSGGCSYSSNEATVKLNVVTNKANGETTTKEELDFMNHCHKFNLSKDDFGTEFFANGGAYTVIGLKPRSSKYPLIGKCSRTGNSYLFSIDALAGDDGVIDEGVDEHSLFLELNSFPVEYLILCVETYHKKASSNDVIIWLDEKKNLKLMKKCVDKFRANN